MNKDAWEHALKALNLGPRFYYDRVGSTNDVAQNKIAEGVPNRTLIVADEQYQGRGRRGRSWLTPRGAGLAFSVIFFPRPGGIQAENLNRATGLGALSVAQALREYFSLPAEIKWPNDVLIQGKKVGGVLVESDWEGDMLRDVVLGVGINVHPHPVLEEETLNFPATSLEKASGKEWERPLVLAKVLETMLDWVPEISSSSFLSAWENLLAFRSQVVQLMKEGKVVAEGKIAGLAEDGSLVLEMGSGNKETFQVGEIHLRPVDRSIK
jgi:BirA family biotin operon repressor/biotin-[acetyl-CoA-carboxylase] ligase